MVDDLGEVILVLVARFLQLQEISNRCVQSKDDDCNCGHGLEESRDEEGDTPGGEANGAKADYDIITRNMMSGAVPPPRLPHLPVSPLALPTIMGENMELIQNWVETEVATEKLTMKRMRRKEIVESTMEEQ
ncbi:hypothetical protein Nepgr_003417 [Nepenthes gracilis]|uniref:Uncharacterized protein n=1 Tax=Nepenthes gracilis TaxID=150966 RepID=A0AAD3RZJ0_NEPGR|nr:hypothetical protein Nepgr_003417 [Nepenthes gracilis]